MDHTRQPPGEGPGYPVYVVKVGPDGNAIAGIRHPLLTAALATHAGWNLRAAGYAQGELYSVIGSMISFALTGKMRAGDSRPSLEERYGSHAQWVRQLKDAAERLVAARYFLAEDAERLLTHVGSSWETAQGVFEAV